MAEITAPPCTRCGSTTEMQRIPNQRRHVTEYRVACESCGLRGPYSGSPRIAARLFANIKLCRRNFGRRNSDFYFCINGMKGM